MMNESRNQRLHALVIGRVQGVGFRYFVMGAAGDLAVTGWVRNCREGYVEVVAEGEKEKLDQLLRILKRGSRSSFVKEVKENWQDYTGEFPGFSVRATR